MALAPDGTVAFSVGDVERPWFGRSCNKPAQAAALLRAGWEPADERQLALAAASHRGEPGHLEVLDRMLPDAEDVLGCPADLPLSESARRAVLAAGGGSARRTMTCSGKQAAMVLACRVNGWPVETYLDSEHPVQVACREELERLSGERVQHTAVDGCAAPQHALSLVGLARVYRAAVLGDGPVRRVADAMRAQPWYVGGTGWNATLLMQGLPGLLAKDGAEGVYAAAMPDGSAVAVKLLDGAERARVPVTVAALRRLGHDAPVLEELATTPVLGGGRQVGEVRAVLP